MQHAARQAYKNVAKETSSARELEASLLLRSAAQFQAICDGWERRKRELNDALLFNRKLWTLFLARGDARRQSAAGRYYARMSPASACS